MVNNSINEAYEEGYDGYYAGKKKKDNPYKRNSDSYTEWDDGRKQAEKDNN